MSYILPDTCFRCMYQEGLSGGDWYQLEASRAVNQAIGRVIRHKDDYGAIIFCDNRFGGQHVKNRLSAWIRPFMKNYEKFGPALRDVKQFFQNAEILVSIHSIFVPNY